MKARLRRTQSGCEGTALFLSLVLVTVVMIMSAGVVQLSSVSSRMQKRSLDQLKAFYLAEAGLAEAFESVSMGRSGAIASEEEPAAYGDGAVWVTSVKTGDGRIWLEASAAAGFGRATLGLVLNPATPSLGFFADQDVVIESVVLVDGFDSGVRPYAAEVALVEQRRMINQLAGPQEVGLIPVTPNVGNLYHTQQLELLALIDALPAKYSPGTVVGILLMGMLEGELGLDGGGVPTLPRDAQAAVDSTISDLTRFRMAFFAGALFAPPDVDDGSSVKAEGDVAASKDEQAPDGMMAQTAGGEVAQRSAPGDGDLDHRLTTHTDHGGLIGSNGNVTFMSDDAGKIMGNVVSGAGGRMTLSSQLEVSGITRARDLTAELAPVLAPEAPELTGIDHSDVIPLLVSAEDGEYPLIQVRAGAEVVLRGPARIVVDDLIVDDGGLLVFDTRDGAVELFAVNSVSLAPGSLVESTAVASDEVTIHGVNTGVRGNGASLDFRGTGGFHGTIYAPDSSVLIGGQFEVFGGIVASRLEIKAGARLHFDDPGYSNQVKVPQQETWRILELPDRGGAVPRRAPSGAPRLGGAHQLDDVTISVSYIDDAGVSQTFVGPESALDWSGVAVVTTVERNADFSSLEDAQERLLRETWAQQVKQKAAADAAPVDPKASAPKPLSAGEDINTVEAKVASETFRNATTDERTKMVTRVINQILNAYGPVDEEYRVFGDFIINFDPMKNHTDFEVYTNEWATIGDGDIKKNGTIKVKTMR